MKSLEFIYQDTQIHFLLQTEGEVMVNATEMAKAYNKRVRNFLRLDSTQEMIKALINKKEMSFDSSDVSYQTAKKEVIYSSNKATYMTRILALEFAAWLDLNFKIWVWEKIDEVLFGNYKKHWDAHQIQEKAKEKMESIKAEILAVETDFVEQKKLIAYFEAEREFNAAANIKRKALRDQLRFEFPS